MASLSTRPTLGPPCVTNGRALLESAGEWKISMIGLRAAAEDTRDGGDHTDQNRSSGNNEKSHKNLVALPCHHVLFPLRALVIRGVLA